jgi:catechol 2,3-dioxygenase-like lactoylglutathione lyase family enzyme
MAKLDSFSSVGIFTKDLKRARTFYTQKVGLKVRSEMPEFGYLELGTTKKGRDAGLNIWEPASWGPDAKEFAGKIGGPTGVGFWTANLDKAVAALKRKRVKVEKWDADGYSMATFYDPDGNGLFLTGPQRPRSQSGALVRLDFVTIAARDRRAVGRFFEGAFGMRKGGGSDFAEYRLAPSGTALMPFTPDKEMYEDPAEYKADMAAIGEHTACMFVTRDIAGFAKALKKRRGAVLSGPEKADWGGLEMRVADPSGNKYLVTQVPADLSSG